MVYEVYWVVLFFLVSGSSIDDDSELSSSYGGIVGTSGEDVGLEAMLNRESAMKYEKVILLV